jgi:hypothetical protein
MDIKALMAKTINGMPCKIETSYQYKCPTPNRDCKDCESEAALKAILTAAQLLELQKEGAKLVVQCADQDMPELYEENFSEGMTLPTISEMRMIKKGMYWLRDEAGFVKVVGG